MSRYERQFSSFRANYHPKNFGVTGEGSHSVYTNSSGFTSPVEECPDRVEGGHRDQWKQTPGFAVSSGGS